jgi:hypothetical protein
MRGTAPAHQMELSTSGSKTPPNESEHADLEKEAGQSLENGPVHVFTLRVFVMGVIVSIGGLIFGYDTGQISGFLEMSNFLELFGDTTKDGKPAFSNTRSGTIVALVRSCCGLIKYLLLLIWWRSFQSEHLLELSLQRQLPTSLVDDGVCELFPYQHNIC